MSACSVFAAVDRLRRRDPTLEKIFLVDKQYNDFELGELVDCLLAYPDVREVCLGNNQLTDETGVKLAQCLAVSSTIATLDLSHNQFGLATYLAVAAALRVNSSLKRLRLQGNQAVEQTHIEAALVEALRLNPDRPADSYWSLNTRLNDFSRLHSAAEQLGHPSLLALLALHC